MTTKLQEKILTHRLSRDFDLSGNGKAIVKKGTLLQPSKFSDGSIAHHEVAEGPHTGQKIQNLKATKDYSISESTKEIKNMFSESIQDIVTHTMQGDAQALQLSLDIALREKIAAALEDKKHEISQNLIGLGRADSTNNKKED